MASDWMFVMIAVASAIVMSSGFPSVEGWKVGDVKGWKGEEVNVFHVGGRVMCQDCREGWNQWAHGATPLKGSKVAVTCMDARKRAAFHGSDGTDDEGEFELQVTKYLNGKELKPESCSVRLVSSPDPTCSVMTDFGRGRTGTRLDRPSHVNPGMIKYTVGPFYFTSPMCDEPDTSDSGKEGGY